MQRRARDLGRPSDLINEKEKKTDYTMSMRATNDSNAEYDLFNAFRTQWS